MSKIHCLRSALGVAAVSFLAAGCAKQPAVIVQPPRDVRVVEISDEVAEQIAKRVAAYIPKAPQAAAPIRTQPVAVVRGGAAPDSVRVVPERREVGGSAVYPRPPSPEIFAPAPNISMKRLRTGTTAAVDSALAWLAEHQGENGAWDASAFGEACDKQCDGAGEQTYTAGVTGMAVLCFVRDGQTSRSGEYKDVVANGLRYLRTIQDSEGCFGLRVSQHFQYNHAAATLAVVEAYALTKSPILRESAQAGVNFVLRSQNPYLGWRYGVLDGDNDTSMTCRMTEVLATALAAGLVVDRSAFRGAVAWADKMTEPEFGRVGYIRRGGPTARTRETMETFPAEHSEAMTAAGLLIRMYSGQAANANQSIRKGADLMAVRPPVWNVARGTNDFYYWLLGTTAMRKVGGVKWNAWRNSLFAAVVENQQGSDAHTAGSWDPVDAWSGDGGRVYATTTLCLALQQVEASLK